MMHLQLMQESLARFSENFAAFLYGLNMNAFCVDFPEVGLKSGAGAGGNMLIDDYRHRFQIHFAGPREKKNSSVSPAVQLPFSPLTTNKVDPQTQIGFTEK